MSLRHAVETQTSLTINISNPIKAPLPLLAINKRRYQVYNLTSKQTPLLHNLQNKADWERKDMFVDWMWRRSEPEAKVCSLWCHTLNWLNEQKTHNCVKWAHFTVMWCDLYRGHRPSTAPSVATHLLIVKWLFRSHHKFHYFCPVHSLPVFQSSHLTILTFFLIIAWHKQNCEI